MTARTVALDNKVIGPGHPCYLVAEVGTTSRGDMEKALKLVEAGARAGVDAVKFQLIDPEQLSDPSVKFSFKIRERTYRANMKRMFQRLYFTEEEWRTIAAACRAAGVHFFATVDHLSGVDLLERVGVPAHKMGAWDSTYRPLVEHIARTGKPLFFDLGPTTQEELAEVVDWFRTAGGRSLLFMHDFHTDEDREMNLAVIRYLNATYPWPAGFSSPARDDDLDMAALALGAHHIEKRLILSRSERAFHAHESVEPDELKAWVARIRHVERALGLERLMPSRKDREQSACYYRSVCTLRPVKVGEAFTPHNLGGKRPGTGLATARIKEIWGRTATRDLDVNTLLTEADFA